VWSSHSYKKQGLSIGRLETLLDNAIEQTELVHETDVSLPSVLTLNHLSERTNVSQAELRALIERSDIEAYKRFSIAKRSGGRRYIKVPKPALAHVQRWIHQHILAPVPSHRASFAFLKGKSIKDCAKLHCEARWLIKLDIENFFETVSEIQVFWAFRYLGYQPLVSFELARLCTIATPDHSPRRLFSNWRAIKSYEAIKKYDQLLLGYLPQGAPSSPLLSNLVMRDCDRKIAKIAKDYGLVYSRYSDDITLSSSAIVFCRKNAQKVIDDVYKVLSQQGYLANFRKTKVISPRARKIVLGLNVNGPVPKLQKEFKGRIRQHLYFARKVGPFQHIVARGFDSVWGFKTHLRGLIDYANMIEPDYADARLAEFNHVEWPE